MTALRWVSSTPIVPAALLSLACLAGGAITLAAVAAGDNTSAAKVRASASMSTEGALAEVQELAKAGRGAEAMRRLDVLVASHPTDARLRFQKGVLLVDQKRAAEAILVFQKLMRDYPALPEPMNNLAVLYVERGEMEKARTTLEAAIRSKPNYGTAFQNLGDLYTRMASRAYARALQIDDADGAPKLALIRNLYEPPQTDGDATLLAQANTQAPGAPLSVPGAPPPRAPEPAPAPAPAPAPVPPPRAAEPTKATPASTGTASSSASASPSKALPAALASAVAALKPASATTVAAASAAGKTLPAPAGSAATRASGAAPAASAAPLPIKPTPKPVAPPPATAPASEVADVNAALRAWAGAWSRRDMTGYLGAYVPGFKGSEASADAWQASRRARILGKASIRLDVSAVKIEIDKGVASASFRQAYAAGGLEVNSRKTLEFIRVNGKWLIRRESVGG